MYTTKSFCNVSQFLSNVPGVVSPIGELSSYASTFSREVATYHHTTVDGYDLLNLRSMRDETRVSMRQELVDQAIGIVKIAVERTINTAGEILVTELEREIMLKASTLKFSGLRLGAMVNSGQYWVPSSITWTDTSTAEQNVHRVWLSLEHFINQYTDFEIVVVPPIVPLDNFFAAPTVIKNALDAITPTQMMDRAQEARDGHPETVIRTMEFLYYDQTSPGRTFKSFWSVVIYGLAGDNIDSIKDALVKHIMANTSRPRTAWEVIFPDIFKRTEFVLAPLWKQFAATTSQLRHGIYSPMIKSGSTVPNFVFSKLPSYAKAHIDKNTISFFFPYRSLAVASIGNVENRNSKILITDYFPDYMGIPTTDPDFNRMSTTTQEWIYKLLNAVLQAEEWYDGFDLQKGYYRVQRGNYNFIGFTYDNVQYLTLTKDSANAA